MVKLATILRNRLGQLTKAEYVFQPDSINGLVSLLIWCKQHNVQYRVLGGGTNTLFLQRRLSGVTIQLNSETFRRIEIQGRRVICGAGVPLARLVKVCVEKGFAGPEKLVGIPGTIGGAVAGNSGSNGVSIMDFCASLTVVNRDGLVKRVERNDLKIKYRHCALKQAVVASAELSFEFESPLILAKAMQKNLHLKQRTQPLNSRSLGCMFLNPPGYSSGKLIDDCGLRGMNFGSVSISEQHANFIVNRRNATPLFGDVASAIRIVEDSVCKAYGVNLQLEVNAW